MSSPPSVDTAEVPQPAEESVKPVVLPSQDPQPTNTDVTPPSTPRSGSPGLGAVEKEPENPSVREMELEIRRLKLRIAHMSRDLDDMHMENDSLHNRLSNNEINKVILQLWIWVKDCKEKRNAYWKLFYSYQRWNNFISVPLLLISSATGITSVAQINNSGGTMEWVVAVLGVLSTAFAAFQRYFRYGEKGEQCKGIAKRYSLLARKGELQANLFESNKIDMESVSAFMQDFRKELDSLQQEIDDVPQEILSRKHIIDPNLSDDEVKRRAMKEGMEEAGIVSDDSVGITVENHEGKRVNRDAMFARNVKFSRRGD